MQNIHNYAIYNSTLICLYAQKYILKCIVIETKTKCLYKRLSTYRLAWRVSELVLWESYLVCGGVCTCARCVKARRGATRVPAAGAQDPAWFPGLCLSLSLRFPGAGACLPALLLLLKHDPIRRHSVKTPARTRSSRARTRGSQSVGSVPAGFFFFFSLAGSP